MLDMCDEKERGLKDSLMKDNLFLFLAPAKELRYS